MAVADVQQLTEDELRAKLYNSLQKKGILDSLKVQSLCMTGSGNRDSIDCCLNVTVM